MKGEMLEREWTQLPEIEMHTYTNPDLDWWLHSRQYYLVVMNSALRAALISVVPLSLT